MQIVISWGLPVQALINKAVENYQKQAKYAYNLETNGYISLT